MAISLSHIPGITRPFAQFAPLKFLVCCVPILFLLISSQIVQAGPPQELLDKTCTDEQTRRELIEKWDSLDEATRKYVEKYWKDQSALNELYGKTANRMRHDMGEWGRQITVLQLKLTAQSLRAGAGGVAKAAGEALKRLPSSSPLDKLLRKQLKKVLDEIQNQGKIDDEDIKALKKSLEKIDELLGRIQEDDELLKRIPSIKRKIEEINTTISKTHPQDLKLKHPDELKGKAKTPIPLAVRVSGGCPPYSVTIKDSASANTISIPPTRDSDIKTVLTFPDPGRFFVDVEAVDSVNTRVKETFMAHISDPAEKTGVKVTKAASATSVNKGEKVTYSYSVTNTGNVRLDSVTVKDDKCPTVVYVKGGTNYPGGVLEPNETWEYECAAVLNATTVNTVTAEAYSVSDSSLQVTGNATVKVEVKAAPPATPCPPPKVEVPNVVNKAEDIAKDELKKKKLVGVVIQREYSDTVAGGLVLDQDPAGGKCVDPGSIVNLRVSRGPKTAAPPDQPPKKFTAEFDCGNSFELAPGDFAGKGCGIIVRGWQDSDKRVEVKVTYNRGSGIEIFPGDTSAPPSLMFTPGVTDYYDRYIFSESFRAKDTAPPGTTTMTITVSQEGSGSVTFTVDVAVLSKGLLPSSGPGIRPPATVAAGSGGAYCVWRYKMFGDPPPCFHFVTAECGTARYAAGSSYELVGANMTWGEADARVAQLSSYFDDAYGCRGTGAGITDTDGDGTPDDKDGCPTNPEKTSPGVCGCQVSDKDSDFDGTPDCKDGCPADINKTSPGTCGCGTRDVDSDGDGVMDCNDQCPSDPNKTKPGQCGCWEPDVDSDGDGALDCNDRCPKDPGKIKDEGYCGCGRFEKDTDGDGWPDCIDNCPSDPYKTDRGVCGCGVPDTDSDGDNTPDCIDKCSKDPTKTGPGLCGCGKPETDSDGDGTPDCKDRCPKDPNKTGPGKRSCGKPETEACIKYDPNNPACEPKAPKGEKKPVDKAQADRLGDEFQRGTGRRPDTGKPTAPHDAAPQPDTYTGTGKPQKEVTCKTDADCASGQVCSGGKCVSSPYPPYPPYGPPPDDGEKRGKDWTEWASRPPKPSKPQKQPTTTAQPPQPPADTRTVICSTTAKSGADAPATVTVKVGKSSGTATFSYSMYTVKDRMIVQYGGRTLLDTGCVSGSKTIPLSLSGVSDVVTVTVQPACEKKGTRWDFRLECPK